MALGEHANLQPTYGDANDWLLLSNGERTTWARVDLDGGTVSALDLDAPGAPQPMSCYGVEANIDAQGRVLVPSRDASTAEELRLLPADGTWEPLGLPVTNIEALHANPYGDAVLIRADGRCLASSDGSRSTTLLDPASGASLALAPDVGIVYVQ